MPLKVTSKRQSTKRGAELHGEAPQSVVNQTGIEKSSSKFIREYIAGLQERSTVEELQDAPECRRSTNTAKNSSKSGEQAIENLEIDTGAARRSQPDYILESLAELDPHDPLAKMIVQKILGIDDASPTMIEEFMGEFCLLRRREDRSGAPSPESLPDYDHYTYICQCENNGSDITRCSHTQGEVTVLDPGNAENVLASGALPPHSEGARKDTTVIKPTSPQDAVAFHADWECLSKYQPNRLLNLQALRDAGYPPELLNRLPSGYHTTVTGLRRVHEEMDRKNVAVDFGTVLKALLVRGGEVRSSTFVDEDGYTKERVVYAEDLVPYVKEGEGGYDTVFWEGMAELRNETVNSGLNDLMMWAAGPRRSESELNGFCDPTPRLTSSSR